MPTERSGIGRGVAFGDFQAFRFGKRQAGDEVDVVGDVVAADRDAAGGGDRAAEIERVVGGAAADVDDQRAAFALLAVERHLGGGDGGEDDVIHFQRHFADQLDAVLDAGADAVDDVEIRLDGFAEQADRRGRVFEAVEPVVADDRVEIDVVLRDVDLAGDGAGLLDVFGGRHRLAIRQAEGAAVVDALDVGAGDGEEHAADFHIAGVLRLGQRVLEAGAGLREIIDLALADAGGFGLADAEDFDGAVRLHLADDHAGLAGADFESDVDFRATCHEGGMRKYQLRLRRVLRSRARRSSRISAAARLGDGDRARRRRASSRRVMGMLYLGIRLMVSIE